MGKTGLYPISALIDRACLTTFDCVPPACSTESELNDYTSINQFLVTEAYDFDIGNLAKTFVYLQDNVVVGFFTTLASLTTIKNTYRKEKKIITNGASNYPVIDIVYFAIDKHYQRKQLGSALMKTLLTMLYENVITHTGVALVTVQALETAVPFYTRNFSFERHASRNPRGQQEMALTIPEIAQLIDANQ